MKTIWGLYQYQNEGEIKMAKMNIEQLIKKHTIDDKVDYQKINEELQEQVSKSVVKESKAEIAQIRQDAEKEFLATNGFNSMDDFNAFKKKDATADSEAVTRLQKELEEAKTQLEESTSTIDSLKNENNDYKKTSAIKKAFPHLSGDELEFMAFKVDKLDGESIEDKLDLFKTENPQAFETPTPNNPVTTGRRVASQPNSEGKLPWEVLVEEKSNIKL